MNRAVKSKCSEETLSFLIYSIMMNTFDLGFYSHINMEQPLNLRSQTDI